jgi:hypothetical protein
LPPAKPVQVLEEEGVLRVSSRQSRSAGEFRLKDYPKGLKLDQAHKGLPEFFGGLEWK